jgi:hypothetical protein
MALHIASPLPKGTEYLVDVAEKACAPHKMPPHLLLGICYAESNFGLALKPPGPAGSGDYIARPCNADRDARMKAFPLPGVERRRLADGIKARKIAGPVDAWVPTSTGWGCGLLQFDYEAHFDFCKSGAWKEPARIFDQACKLLLSGRSTLKQKCPGLAGADLDRAMVASYNAGAGRVAKAVLAKQPLDSVTFHPGYVDKICGKADALAGHSGAWLTGL